MNNDIIPFDAVKTCDCYEAQAITMTRDSSTNWSDGGTNSLSTNLAGGWTYTDGISVWLAEGWDGTGCHEFLLDSGPGAPSVNVCCVPCPAALSARPAFYEWNMAAQKWVKLMDRDPEPPSDLPPGTFDGQIKEV